MTHRHTLLFGTVLAVAGAAIAADHLAHSTPDADLPAAPAPALAPAIAPAPAAVPAPTPGPAVEPAEEPAIIEFAPCAAAF